MANKIILSKYFEEQNKKLLIENEILKKEIEILKEGQFCLADQGYKEAQSRLDILLNLQDNKINVSETNVKRKAENNSDSSNLDTFVQNDTKRIKVNTVLLKEQSQSMQNLYKQELGNSANFDGEEDGNKKYIIICDDSDDSDDDDNDD